LLRSLEGYHPELLIFVIDEPNFLRTNLVVNSQFPKGRGSTSLQQKKIAGGYLYVPTTSLARLKVRVWTASA